VGDLVDEGVKDLESNRDTNLDQSCLYKCLVAERKRQKIARASDREMRRRALVRENRARQLNTAL
jgi:hypothetical protein